MLWLLLLQVLASCLWPGHSEVFSNFSGCPQFFCGGIPPNNALQPASPAWICQRYKNRYRYATLYDQALRIPVYSAYIYEPGSGNRSKTWFVEPQLIKANISRQMETEFTLMKQYKYTLNDIGANQAILQDYGNLTGLDRGHLCPSGHQNGSDSRASTFTLTNIVPQNKDLNGGTWNIYESRTMAAQVVGCDTTYVITGAVPGNMKVRNRVSIPSYIWSAACCLVGTRPTKAWGVIVRNNMNNSFPLLTLGQLETDLTRHYNGIQVTLFHSACPR
ncbi:ENDD1 protein, partial [Mohoua ochrocephala]|nr:ENDD1 protein [Mohoua ochrocephala]